MFCEKISKCRICGNKNFDFILSLGEQVLTGIFPKSKDEIVPYAPLELVKCRENKSDNTCGLLQLNHSFDMGELYGANYGYRSGLNQSMVDHLNNRVKQIEETVSLLDSDLIIDIGSNDSTLLRSYKNRNLHFIGIDPSGKKFNKYYPDDVLLIDDFFSETLIKNRLNKKAKVITSIAMFYDLENPVSFMQEIFNVLDDDGIWVFEQSYMPAMLENIAYDTICHEHLEYYGLKQIKWMTDIIGFNIIDVEFNNVNGGSFCVTVAKKGSKIYSPKIKKIDSLIKQEFDMGLNTLLPYLKFKQDIENNKKDLLNLINFEQKKGRSILGCGASTKGNVILQYCNLSVNEIPFISEVNEDKFGAFTPGTKIPIISEKDARNKNPDYFLVFPWHFKNTIYKREHNFLSKGGKLIFPLPDIQILSV